MIKYNNLIIYYFSGTGNAKKTSKWIINKANELGVNTKLINIEKPEKIDFHSLKGKTLIGFASPTHGFNLPPIMLYFIGRFKKEINADIFILNTRGGMKIYKLFLPGLSGIAQIFPAIILRLKGFRIVAYRPVDLPSNWISLHPGLRKKIVLSIARRWHKKTEVFTTKVLSGKKVYNGLYPLPIDLLIMPISLGYYFIGRFMLAKTFIATNACTNCGICVKNCPVSAIKDRKVLYWSFNCESCMRCMNNCPERAIETAHGITALFWWLVFSIVPFYVTNIITTGLLSTFEINDFWHKIIYNAVSIGGGFLFVYLGYLLLNFLMRFNAFNKIIAYTSLTKYAFWRRYKMPRKPDEVLNKN